MTNTFKQTLRLAISLQEIFPELSAIDALTYSALFITEILADELECKTPSIDSPVPGEQTPSSSRLG